MTIGLLCGGRRGGQGLRQMSGARRYRGVWAVCTLLPRGAGHDGGRPEAARPGEGAQRGGGQPGPGQATGAGLDVVHGDPGAPHSARRSPAPLVSRIRHPQVRLPRPHAQQDPQPLGATRVVWGPWDKPGSRVRSWGQGGGHAGPHSDREGRQAQGECRPGPENRVSDRGPCHPSPNQNTAHKEADRAIWGGGRPGQTWTCTHSRTKAAVWDLQAARAGEEGQQSRLAAPQHTPASSPRGSRAQLSPLRSPS